MLLSILTTIFSSSILLAQAAAPFSSITNPGAIPYSEACQTAITAAEARFQQRYAGRIDMYHQRLLHGMNRAESARLQKLKAEQRRNIELIQELSMRIRDLRSSKADQAKILEATKLRDSYGARQAKVSAQIADVMQAYFNRAEKKIREIIDQAGKEDIKIQLLGPDLLFDAPVAEIDDVDGPARLRLHVSRSAIVEPTGGLEVRTGSSREFMSFSTVAALGAQACKGSAKLEREIAQLDAGAVAVLKRWLESVHAKRNSGSGTENKSVEPARAKN